MGKKNLSKEELKLIEDFANCFDVVKNMPKFLYARYQLGNLKEETRQVGKDLIHYLSNDMDIKKIEEIISNSIEEIKMRREDFGQYEVAPYFRKKMLYFLMKIHRQALDTAILTVLGKKGILKMLKEEEKSIRSKIWAGLDLDVFSMLGGIQILDEVTFSDDIVEEISKECVQTLYSQIENEQRTDSLVKEEKERLLWYILSVFDFKHKVAYYNLDKDLWRFFTIIEAVRLLDVSGEFVHDLIELSELVDKLEKIEKVIT